MRINRNNQKLPLWGMLLTTVLVLGGLCAFVWWTANRGNVYARRAQAAAEQGDWDLATRLGTQADGGAPGNVVKTLSYRQAQSLLDAGDLIEAHSRFEALGPFEDASMRALECTYRLAEQAEAAGELDAALQGYLAAVGYEDALSRADGCRYALAEKNLASGDNQAAFQGFLDLGDFRDAQQRARAIAVTLTEEPNEELALLLAQGYTAADWEKRAQLSHMLQSLSSHRLAAGRGHAVFLTDAGTVRAAGDNAQGQCDVDGWADVTAVDAGYAHTLALTADGGVLAAGDNSCGQCDVNEWKNVVKIFCGPWDSYGLTDAGTVLHCGFSPLTTLSGWSGVTFLAAGNGALFGLRQNGTILSEPADQGKNWQELRAVAVAGHAPVGLKEDGTLLSDGYDLSDWSDVVAVDSSPSLLVGLKVDGTLLAKPLLPVDAGLLSALAAEQDVIGFSVAGTYVLILHDDGTLTAPGAAFDLSALAAGSLS